MATTRITYTDGTSELVPITMRATCKAEAHAIEAGWGPITQSPVRSGAYAAYAAGLLQYLCRRDFAEKSGPAHGRPHHA